MPSAIIHTPTRRQIVIGGAALAGLSLPRWAEAQSPGVLRIGMTMYAGRIVESGPVRAILRDPKHPYTQGLLASTLRKGERGRRLAAIPGAPPDLAALPPGCAFAPRCQKAEPACDAGVPPMVRPSADREVLCRRVEAAAAFLPE